MSNIKRTTVTIDDRRAVYMAVKFRRPRDVAVVSNENFIRHKLKERMGWSWREPAPESIKAVARSMSASLRAAMDIAHTREHATA